MLIDVQVLRAGHHSVMREHLLRSGWHVTTLCLRSFRTTFGSSTFLVWESRPWGLQA